MLTVRLFIHISCSHRWRFISSHLISDLFLLSLLLTSSIFTSCCIVSLLASSSPHFVLMSGLFFSSYLYIYLYNVFLSSLFPFLQFMLMHLCSIYAHKFKPVSLHPVFPHTLRFWESWLLFVICHVSVFFHKPRRDMLCSPAERNLLSVCSAC